MAQGTELKRKHRASVRVMANAHRAYLAAYRRAVKAYNAFRRGKGNVRNVCSLARTASRLHVAWVRASMDELKIRSMS